MTLGVQLFAIGGATGLATLAGGWLALHLKSDLQRLAGFGSGVVIGVALLDLLPEALALRPQTEGPLTVTALVTAGFVAYVLASSLSQRAGRRFVRVARHLGPASLVFHSLMDGLGIGVAFNVSAAAGLVLALAVLAHDLLDGSNTVTLALAGDLSRSTAWRWLALDAAAPMAGLVLSRTIKTSPSTLSGLIAVFAGLFLFIGAVELLPCGRTGSAGLTGAALTALGAALIFAVVRLSAH